MAGLPPGLRTLGMSAGALSVASDMLFSLVWFANTLCYTKPLQLGLHLAHIRLAG